MSILERSKEWLKGTGGRVACRIVPDVDLQILLDAYETAIDVRQKGIKHHIGHDLDDLMFELKRLPELSK